MIGKIKKFIPFKKLFKNILIKGKKIKVSFLRFGISNKKLLKILEQKGGLISPIDSEDKKKLIEIYRKYFPAGTKKIIDDADEICEHIFDLLGSGKKKLGREINWHCDFKSEYCWSPKTFYPDIRYGDKEGVDIKIPWELSRFQHLSLLGQAYFLTNDEKYAQEYSAEIEDWIEKNPFLRGVNWRCAMEVAIRACNWIYAFVFFKNSPSITERFQLGLTENLILHGKYLENNLEKGLGRIKSNHYLSDIVGLTYLGIFLKNQKWLNFGIKELKKEMRAQIYNDGCDFEASTCYHRLVLELFFFGTLLIVINDKNFTGYNYKNVGEKIFGEEYIQKLYKMFEAILYLLKPNGEMPQVGDNDNGRLHSLARRKILDMRYLLTLGAIFFKDSKFKIKEFGFSEDAVWLYGKIGHDIWRNLNEKSILDIKSRAFPDAGWYVMRSNKDYCLVSCGPNGQNGNGGHCHNDKLSYELMINGHDIIIDPGAYAYTSLPNWRDKFRSTAFHNTIVIAGEEQNEFLSTFSMANNSRCKCIKFTEDEKKIIFEGKHRGYQKIIHKRQIIYDKGRQELSIEDKLGGGKNNFYNNLVLSPSVNPDDLAINAAYEIVNGWRSQGYGKKEITKIIRIKGLSYKIKLP